MPTSAKRSKNLLCAPLDEGVKGRASTVAFWLVNWSWCLPQTLIGFLWMLVVKLLDRSARIMLRDRGRVVAVQYARLRGGVSLGQFVFFEDSLYCHEYGHYRQSLMSGPLYLLIIGLPSIGWAILKNAGFFADSDYMDFYTERWAENLCARMPRKAANGSGAVSDH